MKCKFCFAELEEDVTVCPICGKDLTETEELPAEEIAEETEEIVEEAYEEYEEEYEEECEEDEEIEEDDDEYEEIVVRRKKKKKMPKGLKVTLAAVGGVVLAGALAVAVLYGMGIKLSSVGAFLGLAEADINYKSDYTVSDAKVEKQANEVVAKVGDQKLTNEQLQVFYWAAAREYVSQYNTALMYGQSVELGFDLAKPLDEQVYDPITGKTWQQYFLETALRQWQSYACIVQLAEDADYVLSQEWQDYLDTYDEEMTTMAQESGYTDVEALIDAEISKGSSVAAHYHYFELQYIAMGYLETLDAELVPTEQELEDYYTAHEAEMTEDGYGKDAGKYYDVRHIFITVEGETEELEDGTYGYTEAQWEACREKAQKMLDDFLANDPTEEKFAELAKEHSEDTGSASYGGLYSYLTKDYGFIQEFEDWYVDESRQIGDTGLVKNTGSSKVGYHIMYFSGSKEIWRDEAETGVLNEKMEVMLQDAEAKYPMTVDYKNLVLGEADLSA